MTPPHTHCLVLLGTEEKEGRKKEGRGGERKGGEEKGREGRGKEGRGGERKGGEEKEKGQPFKLIAEHFSHSSSMTIVVTI